MILQVCILLGLARAADADARTRFAGMLTRGRVMLLR